VFVTRRICINRMAEKKKYYAVAKGRKPGVYTLWSGPGGAEGQVKGFAGAKYRGFATRSEAEAYVKSGGQTASLQEPLPELEGGEMAAKKTGRTRATPEKRAGQDYQAELAAGRVVIFSDGASTGNPGPGGYGVVVLTGKDHRELSAGFRCTTNNRMEILGCIAGLESLQRKSRVLIFSDSRYVVNAVNMGWAKRWRKNGWMRAPDSLGNLFRAENVDLWERMLDLLEYHEVTFQWVKGHAKNIENERCDRLAVAAAHAPDLPEDPGYPSDQCK
jgi:ribonuclease HI